MNDISFVTNSHADDKGNFLVTFIINGKQEVLNEKSKLARPSAETVEGAWFELYKVVAGKLGWIDCEDWVEEREMWLGDILEEEREAARKEEKKRRLKPINPGLGVKKRVLLKPNRR